ncbi:MAG: hypothetical protein CMB56_002990 [Methanobacteriota archaeon]|nr:MAG: hypothetical protein CMB56_002990 [Euryarchaeota archaeon]
MAIINFIHNVVLFINNSSYANGSALRTQRYCEKRS